MDSNGHNYSHIFHIFAVSNKWIREGAQTFNRPCSLERKTKHDYE